MFDPFATEDQLFNSAERANLDFGTKAYDKKANFEGALTRVNDPLIYLRECLLKIGYNLKSADNNSLDNCEWVFFYNSISVRPYSGWRGLLRMLKTLFKGKPLIRNLYKECIQAGMGDRVVLFLWETYAVSPENMDTKWHNMFPLIFTSQDELVDGKKIIKLCVPQMRDFPELTAIDFYKKKLLVNISMNKTSRHPKELYTARQKTIRYFEENHPDSFDLFGLRWDNPGSFLDRIIQRNIRPYTSYRGPVKNKWDVLPNYRFSLCYENARDVPGYVTEKLFDCIRCGTVPIYWGADNICEYVDPEVFIDRRSFDTDADLYDFISKMSRQEYESYLDAIAKYLSGPKFAQFLPEAFANTIINTLKLRPQN